MRRRLRSFGYAFLGLRTAFATQPNFRIHCAAATAALALNVTFSVSRVEWALVVLAIAAVMAAECLNSGLEMLGDAVTRERHELVGKAKDLGAAATLLCALGALAVGLIVYLPHVAALFR
jgi:diacylglycerol kinase